MTQNTGKTLDVDILAKRERDLQAGHKAQELFKVQAMEAGYMIESISQDQESFRPYVAIAQGIPVKRGDFFIRQINIEIEVKCKTLRKDTGSINRYIVFEKDQLERHINMMALTGDPVLIACYPLIKNKPDPNHLYFFDVQKLSSILDKLPTMKTEFGACYKLSLEHCKKGFDIVEKYRNSPK